VTGATFRLAVAALAAAALLAPPAPAAPPPPALSASSAILVAPQTGDVLLRKQADAPRPVASATKLMTALVVLESARLDDVLTAVPYDAAPAESRIDLRAGERMTVRDLLRALLLESANDAAATLAAGTGGSQVAFVARMNERATQLGLRATGFANPIGLDDPGNHSSARDLVALTRRLRRNAFFRRTVALPSVQLASGARPRLVENRNDLVGQAPGVDGVKTGHTQGAGYVLVGSATRNGITMLSAVLGEPGEAARDLDTVNLLRWGLDQYRLAPIVRPDRVVARSEVRYRPEDRIELVPARRVTRVLREGERPRISVSAPRRLEGPLPQGARAGTVTVRLRGRVVARVALVTAQPVPEVSIVERAADRMLRPVNLALLGLGIMAGGALVTVLVRRRRADREAMA
jgi:serine-type D-Ala-D-Ala carboxypeptidase (penicillin-binding protein 5/6)